MLIPDKMQSRPRRTGFPTTISDELQQFRSDDSLSETLRERILSPTFPELNLTVDQVFAAGS